MQTKANNFNPTQSNQNVNDRSIEKERKNGINSKAMHVVRGGR